MELIIYLPLIALPAIGIGYTQGVISSRVLRELLTDMKARGFELDQSQVALLAKAWCKDPRSVLSDSDSESVLEVKRKYIERCYVAVRPWKIAGRGLVILVLAAIGVLFATR